MPYELPLPKRLKAQGWKVKIREKERVEPPHVTILHNEDEWRIGLRDGKLLVPPGGRLKDIHHDVMQLVAKSWEGLKAAWDQKYPENPVSSAEDDDGVDRAGLRRTIGSTDLAAAVPDVVIVIVAIRDVAIPAAVPVRIEYALLAGTAAGLALLAMLTLTAQTVLASRRTVAALRIGE